MPVTRTTATLAKSNGIDICWDSFGDRDRPAVLLIMGLACQMIAWDDAFCDRLAERGYRVIRFDNRDIGLSTSFSASGVPDVEAAFMALRMGRPVAAPYLITDMTRDSIGLLDALAIARAHVVGLSMGGMIAQTMAIQCSERVASLTSIMSSTGEPGLPAPTPEAAAILLKPAPVDQTAYIENFLARWKLLRAGTFPEDEALDLELARRNFARGLNPAGVARQLVAILASGSRKEALGSVRVPTLVLHGDVDPLVPLACGVATHRAVPGSKFAVIKGMGHALPVRMWPDIVDAIATHAV